MGLSVTIRPVGRNNYIHDFKQRQCSSRRIHFAARDSNMDRPSQVNGPYRYGPRSAPHRLNESYFLTSQTTIDNEQTLHIFQMA